MANPQSPEQDKARSGEGELRAAAAERRMRQGHGASPSRFSSSLLSPVVDWFKGLAFGSRGTRRGEEEERRRREGEARAAALELKMNEEKHGARDLLVDHDWPWSEDSEEEEESPSSSSSSSSLSHKEWRERDVSEKDFSAVLADLLEEWLLQNWSISLPTEVWLTITEQVSQHDRLALSLTCKSFRRAVLKTYPGGEHKTDLGDVRLMRSSPSFGLGWFQWVWGSFDRRRGEAPDFTYEGESLTYFYDSNLMFLAGFQGSIGVIRWLSETKGIPLDTKGWRGALGAALGGRRAALEWFQGEGYKFSPSTCTWAAYGGRLDLLRWLRTSEDCPWNIDTSVAAASAGHMHVLRWAVGEGVDVDQVTCDAAIREGRLDVMHWLVSQGCTCRLDWSCREAIEHGQVRVLKWLRALPVNPFDPRDPWLKDELCALAAEYGQLEALQWLRGEGFPWDPRECRKLAGDGGHRVVAKWIDRNRRG